MSTALHLSQLVPHDLSAQAGGTREIVLIDSAVTDYLDLVAGVRSPLEVVVPDSARDGLDLNEATILGASVGEIA